eukprot:scaffold9254_cov50-Phaeocystis_antarctica.AAC.2
MPCWKESETSLSPPALLPATRVRVGVSTTRAGWAADAPRRQDKDMTLGPSEWSGFEGGRALPRSLAIGISFSGPSRATPTSAITAISGRRRSPRRRRLRVQDGQDGRCRSGGGGGGARPAGPAQSGLAGQHESRRATEQEKRAHEQGEPR